MNVNQHPHQFVLYEDFAGIKYVLEPDVSAIIQNSEGITALELAMRLRNRHMVELLLEYCHTNIVNPETNFGYFHIACMLDNRTIVEKFLDRGVDLNSAVANIKESCQETHCHAWPIRARKYFAFYTSRVQLALDCKWACYTPLHFATENGCANVVQLLLKRGAAVNVKDARGVTPLHLACSLDDPMKIVKKLLLAGANPNVQNVKGVAPMHVAIEREKVGIMKILLKHGAKFDLVMWGLQNTTCLHLAARNANTDVLEFLLKKKIDINVKDMTGGSPLHAMLDAEVSVDYDEVADMLIDAGLDVNQQDNLGQTALHRACHQMNGPAVWALLRQGSSLSILDHLGHTPVWYVLQSNCNDMRCFIHAHMEKMRLIWPSSYPDLQVYEESPCERRDYIKRCELELQSIRNYRLDSSTSLFDVVVHRDRKLETRHIQNEDLWLFIDSIECQIQYPIYAAMIKTKLRSHYQKYKLVPKARQRFTQIIDLNLPYEVIDRIFEELSNVDLCNIIEAGREENIAKRKLMLDGDSNA